MHTKEQNKRQTNGKYKDEGDWETGKMKRKGREKEHKKTKKKEKDKQGNESKWVVGTMVGGTDEY